MELKFFLLLLQLSFVVYGQELENEAESRFGGGSSRKGMTIIREWSQLDFEFSSQAERDRAIATNEYIPGRLVPIDVDVHYSASGSQIFMSVPRFQMGVPSTLNKVTPAGKLRPFPSDRSWHRQPEQCSPNRIVSVYRMMIDECERLWVLDTGIVGDTIVCQPQILAFDVNTEELLHQYQIPREQYHQESILVTPVVDVRDPKNGCSDTYVYIADVTRFGLIVYNVAAQTSWRITNNLFYPYPPYGFFTIAGESFDLMDGILGMALSPNVPGKDRTLYFQSLSSVTTNRVSTSLIRNQTIFLGNEEGAPREFYLYENTRPSQSAAMAIDRNGVAYFGLAKQIAVACWNTQDDYGGRNVEIVAQNPKTLQFASGVKVISNRKGGQELWLITVRFQKIMNGSLDPQETNFRIQAAKTDDLIRGSRCSARPTGGYGYAQHSQRLTLSSYFSGR